MAPAKMMSSRPSYFDLYPERRTASNTPSASTSYDSNLSSSTSSGSVWSEEARRVGAKKAARPQRTRLSSVTGQNTPSRSRSVSQKVDMTGYNGSRDPSVLSRSTALRDLMPTTSPTNPSLPSLSSLTASTSSSSESSLASPPAASSPLRHAASAHFTYSSRSRKDAIRRTPSFTSPPSVPSPVTYDPVPLPFSRPSRRVTNPITVKAPKKSINQVTVDVGPPPKSQTSLEDLFAGPKRTELEFDPKTRQYVLKQEPQAQLFEGDLALEEDVYGAARCSDSLRSRERTTSSKGSFITMTAEPTAGEKRWEALSQDPTTPNFAPKRAKTIDEIVRNYRANVIIAPSRSPSLNYFDDLASPQANQANPSPAPSAMTFRTASSVSTATSAKPRLHVKTIEEIIREHSSSLPSPKQSPTPAQAIAASARQRTVTCESENSRSSMDSLGQEIRSTLKYLDTPPPSASYKNQSFTSSRRTTPEGDRASFKSSHSSYARSQAASPSLIASASFDSPTFGGERELATILRSPRLTRLLTLRRPPNHGLTVSLADVGAVDGHPVIVFLGLGCVRYLIALYDEIAEAFGLRLICIDRWGLGRTSEVPDEKRGFLEWAAVFGEVMDQLGLRIFSLLAHSAGAPYALAASLRNPDRVTGSIHLLAPWVSTSADSLNGAYKLLKYVPSAMLRTAQAAEWKVTAWKLGKPPVVTHKAVGYDRKVGIGKDDIQLLGNDQQAGSDDEEGSTNRSPVILNAKQESLKPLKSKRSRPFLTGMFRDGRSSPGPLRSPTTLTPNLGATTDSRRTSMVSNVSSISVPPSPALSSQDLANGLMRASYAESLKGGTSDLMVILERTSKVWGFRHEDIEHPVKVWHGDKDERISMPSVLSLERSLAECKITVVEGADHSLMTNARVMIEVLKSIASEHGL